MAPVEVQTLKKRVKKASKMPNAIQQTNSGPIDPKTTDGEPLTFEYYWATNLHPAQFLWVFELFNDNMLELYKRSNWGYEEESKKQELQATTARYIIVRDSKKKHVGYVHYRFDLDHGVPVVYCYELQIAAKYQKKGVGTLLIDTLIRLAKATGMEKVMATVFLFNGTSLAFFHKNGFRLDESSPQPGNDEHDYVILSKCVVPGKEELTKEKENQILEDLILRELNSAKITDVTNAPEKSRILAASEAAAKEFDGQKASE